MQAHTVLSEELARQLRPPVVQPSLDDRQFFFIWIQGSMRPKRRHATFESARDEALRLRQIGVTGELFIYEARQAARWIDVGIRRGSRR